MRVDFQRAIDHTGSKSKGYCARGLSLTLQALGLQSISGNAWEWTQPDKLPAAGWVKLELPPGLSNKEIAERAPPGAILAYNKTTDNPKAKRGERFGHVEMVAVDKSGKRKYLSDYASDKPGGSNINRPLTVWVHPSIQGNDPAQWRSTRGTLAGAVRGYDEDDDSIDLRGRFGDAADPNAKVAPLMALAIMATLLSGNSEGAVASLKQVMQP